MKTAARPLLHALVLGLLAGLPHDGTEPVLAQEVSVRAFLTPTSVAVGRSFTLNVEISGTQSLDSQPQLPDLSPFASYRGSGSSTSMQMVGGRTSISLTMQYRYQALAEGTFQIPAFSVEAGGETRRTEPLELTILPRQSPQPGGAGEEDDPGTVGSEDLFLTAEASRTSVYVGEPLIVEYRIFTRVDVSSYSFTRVPEPQGFWMEELPMGGGPQVEQVTLEGVQYASAVIRRVALVPTGPGTRTVEPLGIEAQVRVRSRSRDPFEGFFDLDRSSLFGRVVAAGALSNALEIEVEPLPPDPPEPFSGIVGDLGLVASLDQDSVQANQAVTLTITARGLGNMKTVPEPTLDLPRDFEVYPPEVSESVQRSGAGLRGTKSWKYVLIPRAPGRREIPAVTMSYFDPSSEGYRTTSTEALPLTVTGEVAEGPAGSVRGGVANLREDIRFIHLDPGTLTRSGDSPFKGPVFWTLLLLPMATVLGALALRRHRERLAGDPAYARRRRAGRVARRRLGRARTLAGEDDARAFYAEVARALRGLAADRLNVAEAGMQLQDLTQALRERGASEETVREIADCLDHCDRQRFAPPEADAGVEARFLDRVGAVMTALNREVKR